MLTSGTLKHLNNETFLNGLVIPDTVQG